MHVVVDRRNLTTGARTLLQHILAVCVSIDVRRGTHGNPAFALRGWAARGATSNQLWNAPRVADDCTTCIAVCYPALGGRAGSLARDAASSHHGATRCTLGAVSSYRLTCDMNVMILNYALEY